MCIIRLKDRVKYNNLKNITPVSIYNTKKKVFTKLSEIVFEINSPIPQLQRHVS